MTLLRCAVVLLLGLSALPVSAQVNLTIVHAFPNTDSNEFDERNPVDVLVNDSCNERVVLGQAIGPATYDPGDVRVALYAAGSGCGGDRIAGKKLKVKNGGDYDVAIHPSKKGKIRFTRFDNGPTLAARQRAGTTSLAIRHVAQVGPVTVAWVDENFDPEASQLKNGKQIELALDPGFVVIEVNQDDSQLTQGEGLTNESTAYLIYFWGGPLPDPLPTFDRSTDLHAFKRPDR